MLYNISIAYPVNENDFVFYFLLLPMFYQNDKTFYHITIFIFIFIYLCTIVFI